VQAMKAILEFNLPEDLESHNMALNGVKYNGVIESVIVHIRQKLKYIELTSKESDLLRDIQNLIREEME
jgi:hypothetical protein